MKEVATTKKTIKRDYTYAVGRQREAVARVRLYENVKASHAWGEHSISKDQMLVNEMPIEKYFSGIVAKAYYIEPVAIVNAEGKFAFTIKVAGGGVNSQLDAAVKGIARALSAFDTETYRKLLKDHGMLSRDARVRERRKVGTGGKARRKKQSPKR